MSDAVIYNFGAGPAMLPREVIRRFGGSALRITNGMQQLQVDQEGIIALNVLERKQARIIIFSLNFLKLLKSGIQLRTYP